MRILQVISSLNIGSGIANTVVNYYRAINKEKIQFDFLLFEDGEKTFAKEVEDLGARVYYIVAPTLWTLEKYKKRLKEFFSVHRGEWEAVHIHEILIQKFITKYAHCIGINKIIIHSHSTKFVSLKSKTMKEILVFIVKKVRNLYLLSNVNKNANIKLACSAEAGETLFGKDEGVIVLNNAIDVEQYKFDSVYRKRYRDKFNICDNEICIMNIGRICAEKNQHFLVEIFAEICKKKHNYKLMLVGDGNEKKTIIAQLQHFHLEDKVIFAGKRTDVPQLLSVGDCFVFPSLFEGLGIALVEAQASGLPCIASDTIPKIANCTGKVEFINIGMGASVWAQKIIEIDKIRYDETDAIKKAGFDLQGNKEILENIYLSEE